MRSLLIDTVYIFCIFVVVKVNNCHSAELYVNVIQNISRAKYTNPPSHLAAVLQCLDLEPSAELMK